MKPRPYVHRARTVFGADTAFLMPDGLDIESSQNLEVVRRRVFFDDIHFVTLHHERGVAYLIITALCAAAFLGFGILLLAIDTDTWPFALPFLTVGAVALVAFLVRLLMGRDVITVFGRRSKAVLRFGSFRRERAREVYGQVCAAVRRGQSAIAQAPAEAPPALSPDIPMPPSMT